MSHASGSNAGAMAAMGGPLGVTEEDSVDLLFHGQAYNLAATVIDPAAAGSASAAGYAGTEPMLAIDLEELSTGALWHAEYSASYIESITSKTGSFKRFPVLVKMLLTAMRHQTDSVALDLLTYSDLELLKSRKMGAGSTAGGSKPAGGSGGAGGGNNKRYLILTYVVEFDRVHYPLPLQPLEAPTVASLQRQIRRLRSEVANFRALSGLQPNNTAALAPSGLPTASQALLVSSVSGMQKELVMLRERLADVTSSERSLGDALRDANTRLKAATDAAAAGDAALEKLRAASRAEVKRLRAEVADLRERVMVAEASAATAAQQQAQQAQQHAQDGKADGSGAGGPRKEGEVLAILRETNEQLRARVRDLTRQLALAGAGGGAGGGPSMGGSGSGMGGGHMRSSSASSVHSSPRSITSASRGRNPNPSSAHNPSNRPSSVGSQRSVSSASRGGGGSGAGAGASSSTMRRPVSGSAYGSSNSRIAASPLAQPLGRASSAGSSRRSSYGASPSPARSTTRPASSSSSSSLQRGQSPGAGLSGSRRFGTTTSSVGSSGANNVRPASSGAARGGLSSSTSISSASSVGGRGSSNAATNMRASAFGLGPAPASSSSSSSSTRGRSASRERPGTSGSSSHRPMTASSTASNGNGNGRAASPYRAAPGRMPPQEPPRANRITGSSSSSQPQPQQGQGSSSSSSSSYRVAAAEDRSLGITSADDDDDVDRLLASPPPAQNFKRHTQQQQEPSGRAAYESKAADRGGDYSPQRRSAGPSSSSAASGRHHLGGVLDNEQDQQLLRSVDYHFNDTMRSTNDLVAHRAGKYVPGMATTIVSAAKTGGSPGRVTGSAGGAAGGAGASMMPPPPATVDSTDIDSRLMQLQAFLKAAKSGAPLPNIA